MNKKILTVSIILVIVLGSVAPSVLYPSKAIALSQSENNQRELVWKYLVKYSKDNPKKFPNWKIRKVLQTLDKASYFSMPRAKRLAYLHANLPNSMALIAVVYAEGWQNLNIKVYQSKGSERIKFSNDNQMYKTYWVQFFNDVFFTADGKLQKARIAEWGSKGAFTKKGYWPKQNLDLLYNKFWTDFKKNRNNIEFDCTETERLHLIWEKGGFKNYAVKNFPSTGGAVPISVFGDSPFDDILFFVPVERLVGLAVKGLVSWSKVSRVPGLTEVAAKSKAVGAKVGGAAVRATNITTQAILRITSRFLGTIDINMARMFRSSHIPRDKWQDVATTLVRSVSSLLNSSFAKYTERKTLLEALNKTYIVNKFPNGCNYAGVCYAESGYNKYYTSFFMKLLDKPQDVVEKKGFSMILIRDDFVHTAGDYTASKTFVHETFHAISSKVRSSNHTYILGYNKLNEGLTDYHANNYVGEVFGITKFDSGYPQEVEVIMALKRALTRKYGDAKAEEILRWIYFKSSSLDKFDAYTYSGFTIRLAQALKDGRYSDAIYWLNTIKLV